MNPPTGRYIRDTRCQASVKDIFAISDRPPVDLAYIAGAISFHGDECIIRDYPVEQFNMEELEIEIKNLNADYVVINTTLFTYKEDLSICTIIKSIDEKIVIIAKGAIFFQNPTEIMNEFPLLDIAVSGEEEQTFEELAEQKDLQTINNITFRREEEIKNNPRKLNHEFTIKKPRIDLIDHERYRRPDMDTMQATIVVGRGCPGKCIYCIAPIVGGNCARYREVEAVIEEINDYYCKYNIQNFYFSADTFTWNEKWVLDFCARINDLSYKISWVCNSRIDKISNGLLLIMKQAGCWGMSIGIESGNEVILKKIGKGLKKQQIMEAIRICRKHNIVSLLHFIIG